MQWKHFGPDESTCDIVDHMRAIYPSLFTSGADVFWYLCLILCWLYVYMYACCKHHIELCYKAPISNKVFMYVGHGLGSEI